MKHYQIVAKMQTKLDIANGGMQTDLIHAPLENQPPQITREAPLVVPLSAVKLDIPFDQPKAESSLKPQLTQPVADVSQPAVVTEANVRDNGAATTSFGSVETTDQVMAGLTLPLKAKLWLLFGGFTLLFLILAGVALGVFLHLTSISHEVSKQQKRLDQIHQLQSAFNGERGALSQSLLTTSNGVMLNDFELKLYNTTFENNLFLLKEGANQTSFGANLDDIQARHYVLSTSFIQIVGQLQAGTVSPAVKSWQQAAPLIQDLTARLTNLADFQSQQVEVATTGLEQEQGSSFLVLGLVGMGGAVFLVFLIWLGNHFVIGPMGRLNIKLGQLLYSQTARITDRLNNLEHEIDTQSQKVAAARHDLKLPLTHIRNAAEISLICQSDLTKEVKESFEDIIQTSDESAKLINSLLARSDNRLHLVEVDLASLVERVVELVDLREYKLNLKLELSQVVADEQLIEHVLLNLLSNARKFSVGGIKLGTSLATNPVSKVAEAELWVWNDGPVIATNEREAIFRPGVQTEVGQRVKGHGLGLSIAKSIVERHGGRIVVESHEKIGTKFRVFLPVSSKHKNELDEQARLQF